MCQVLAETIVRFGGSTPLEKLVGVPLPFDRLEASAIELQVLRATGDGVVEVYGSARRDGSSLLAELDAVAYAGPTVPVQRLLNRRSASIYATAPCSVLVRLLAKPRAKGGCGCG